MSKTFKSFDQYVQEAELDPFELPVSEDHTLVISAPTGVQMLRFAEAYRSQDVQAMLWALTGDQWAELEPLLARAGYKAMNEILADLMIHFDLNEEVTLVGPGGGEIREKDPRKIQALRRKGYSLKGEA